MVAGLRLSGIWLSSSPACGRRYLDEARSKEGDDDGDHVDGQLELKELGDAVVDVAAPHHRLDDAREIVVSQDDVGRFLGNVRACDSLHDDTTASLSTTSAPLTTAFSAATLLFGIVKSIRPVKIQ